MMSPINQAGQGNRRGQGEGTGQGAIAVLEDVRSELSTLVLPLDVPGAQQARTNARQILAQLDDYILPRYRSLDAPLLAVVGGSTGAGKSTLVNALVGFPVTRAGAIRPTTRQPILVHHPEDAHWFSDQRVLPGLGRIKGTVSATALPSNRAGVAPDAARVSSLVLVGHPEVPQGIALLDAPDVDSISDDNRALAGQLLAAADLWVFVTTANRYADAVPWQLLLDAASRDITVAIVLDRVPVEVQDEVAQDLTALLQRQGLGSARLFVVNEEPLDAVGMLPASAVAPLQEWLHELAADTAHRTDIARRTLAGAVRAMSGTVESLAAAATGQAAATKTLQAAAIDAHQAAVDTIIDSTKDGALLRGEVLARWQDFVGTGEFFRALEQNVGRLRDRIGAFFRGQPPPAVRVETAIETGLQAVIVAAAGTAAETTDRRWRTDAAGRHLLGLDDLSGASPDFADRAAAEIRAWQASLMELIQTEGAGKRSQARWLSIGINGLGAALMIVVFSMTAGLSGLEVGVAGGTAVVGQKLLEAVFGEDAVRRMAQHAREDLHLRCQQLLAAEQQRFLLRLPDQAASAGERLAAHARALGAMGGAA